MQRTVALRSAPPAKARVAWERMVADLGDAQAIWDTGTAVPTRVWGLGLPAPGAVATPGAARRAAHGFLAAHLDLLAPGSRADDLVLASDHVSAGIRSVGFVQHYKGRPVVGGQVSLRYKHDRLALVASEALPHVSAVLTDSPVAPAVARARALESLRAEAPAALAGAVSGPVILPLAGNGKTPSYREALAVVVASEAPLGRWTVWVDAATGEPLARESTLRSATGTIHYHVPERSPTYGPRVEQPAVFLDLKVDGVDATTDAQGVVTFGPDVVNIGLGVRGDYVRIVNADGDLATLDTPLMSGGDALWSAPADDLIDAQLTAYIAANTAKEYVRGIAKDLPWLEDQVKVTVNSKVGTCNAMSDGDSLYFYQGEGDKCQNTARITDVVYHELGHSVHQQSIIPGVGLFEGALSEGISDYLAATIVNDPKMARGFFFGEEPLRDLDPDGKEWHWPEDRGEAHDEGRIIGGTLWDLRVALMQEMGDVEGHAHTDTIWYEATRRAMDIPSMYPEALLVDDDDGDLSNGTPHSCTIDKVFYAHGLVGALILGGKVSTQAAAGDGTVPVELEIGEAKSPCIDLAPTAAKLEWQVRGTKDITSVPMSAKTGGYAAALPAFPDGTVVQYRVIADLSDGTTANYPDNEGYPWYERYYGPVEPIYCTSFEGDPTADGWEIFGEWQVAAPAGKSGDPTAPVDGTQVIGIDLTDDGRYSPDKVSNLRSPTIDTSEFPVVRLQYQRWLNVEDAFFDAATILADDQQVWQNFNSMMDNESDTHHRDKEWNFHDVDLTKQAADGSVQLTFRLASDGGLELGGWTLDQLCVVGVREPVGAPVCGDGMVQSPETCDDGNTAAGDGCAADCSLEPDADPTGGPDTGGADTDTSGSPADDSATGAGQVDDDGAGCGCRNTGNGQTPAALLLLLAAIGRRRRARP